MNSFSETATLIKLNFFAGIFQGFCLQDSENFLR